MKPEFPQERLILINQLKEQYLNKTLKVNPYFITEKIIQDKKIVSLLKMTLKD